ncbi:carboxy terminal-processing peptidase [Halieaceae bacterium]|nr:carboxy terminal-processing peptidase [Halieaceae bacterium]
MRSLTDQFLHYSLFFLVMVLAVTATPSWALLQFSAVQEETAIELVEKLEQRHYSRKPFNDDLSSAFLDNYLDSLDPNRLFFYLSDIREFEVQRYKLDDLFSKGKLRIGAEIFDRYQIRVEQRINNILDSLETSITTMDFTIDESLPLDDDSINWAVTKKEADNRWRKQIKNQVLSLKMANKEQQAIIETIDKRYRNQLARMEQLNADDAFQIFANALTELYDPHTNYFSPRRSENFNINMSLSLEGIGAVLQREDDYTKVIRLVAAGPADKQGELQPSDKIVAVGQNKDGELEDVIGWRLDEVVELIRGPKGTTVKLEVIPANAQSPDQRKVISIVRNKVKLEEQSAHKKLLEIETPEGIRKIGIIEVPAFYIDFEAMRRDEPDYKSTTRDVKKLLGELLAEGAEGIVVDLRNNGGGSLQEANELTGLFIEYGPTVQIRHSSSRVFRDGKRQKSAYYEGPLAVMINRLSASASEIFAGAIQDYQRGVIIGGQTFGKGTVQSLIPLTVGQLKLTESKFYRISGESTQHRGVIPDVEFPSLYNKEEVGESALEHAMDWDHINPIRHKLYDNTPALIPLIKDKSRQRIKTNPDFVYINEQLALSEEVEKIIALPLNEKARKALSDTQKQKSIAIENKRRVAKGLAPLNELEELKEDESELAEKDNKDDAEEDSMLREASRILIDAISLQGQQLAVRH